MIWIFFQNLEIIASTYFLTQSHILEMQEIMSKNDKTPKKYTKEIESMEKLKKRLEGKLDFKLDWNQGQIRTIKDNLNWSSLRDNDIFVEILIEKMDPKGISLFWHRKEDPNT